MSFSWGDAASLGTSLANIAGSAYSIFGGSGSDGGNGPVPNKPFKNRITTPGYTFGSGQLTRLNGQSARYGDKIKNKLHNTMQQVRPGYGRLTQAVTDQIRNQGAQAVGNLRSSLAQRGLLGASFANDAITRAEAEYSQQEAMARAAAFQEEMTATQNLIGQQMTLQQNMVARDISELGISTQFLSGVDQVMEKQSKMLSDLAMLKANSIMGGQLG